MVHQPENTQHTTIDRSPAHRSRSSLHNKYKLRVADRHLIRQAEFLVVPCVTRTQDQQQAGCFQKCFSWEESKNWVEISTQYAGFRRGDKK